MPHAMSVVWRATKAHGWHGHAICIRLGDELLRRIHGVSTNSNLYAGGRGEGGRRQRAALWSIRPFDALLSC